jgi:hypothetical protein
MSAEHHRFAKIVDALSSCVDADGSLVDECLEVLRSPLRIERFLYDRAAWALRAHGVDRSEIPPHRPLALRVGEALVLLAGQREGTTGILRARSQRSSADESAIAAPSTAEEAVDALRRSLFRARRWLWYLEVTPSLSFEVDLLSARDMEIEGASLGLAAVAAAVSFRRNQRLPSSVVCAAAVHDDGALRPVASLDRKLTALREAWPEVKTLIVAQEQVLPSSSDLEFKRSRSVLDALQLLGFRSHHRRMIGASAALAASTSMAFFFSHHPRRDEAHRHPISAIERHSEPRTIDRGSPTVAWTVEPIIVDRSATDAAVTRSRARPVFSSGGRVSQPSIRERATIQDSGVVSIAVANQAPLLRP